VRTYHRWSKRADNELFFRRLASEVLHCNKHILPMMRGLELKRLYLWFSGSKGEAYGFMKPSRIQWTLLSIT
jgi:hypothetical protein